MLLQYLSEKTIEATLKLMEGDDNLAHIAFMTFTTLAQSSPEKIVQHDKRIMKKITDMNQMGYHGSRVLIPLASKYPVRSNFYMCIYTCL